MARFGKILLAALSTTLLATSAFAATATIKSATKGVQIGKEGAWKDAAPGMAITEADFLKIPDNATVTVVLPDNSTKDFPGRAVVPGRRLSDKNSAGAMIWFSRGVQKIAGSGETTTAANGAGRGAGEGDTAAKLGQKNRHLVYDGSNGAVHNSSDAIRADFNFSAAHYEQADEAAKASLADADAPAVEHQLAHLILGELAASTASYSDALKEYDIAATVIPETGSESEGVRRRALLQRGQAHSQLGNDKQAVADFQEVAKSTDKVAAAQAKFFLGALAFSQHDTKSAKSWFEQLKGDNQPLYATGMAMLEPTK